MEKSFTQSRKEDKLQRIFPLASLLLILLCVKVKIQNRRLHLYTKSLNINTLEQTTKKHSMVWPHRQGRFHLQGMDEKSGHT